MAPIQSAFSVLLGALTIATVHSKIITSPAGLSHTTYDFVILGGGTAGCVLANRLTENAAVKVLVVEAGASPDGVINAAAPFLGVTLPGSELDWNFTSTSQSGLGGRIIPYARGFTLGGSSVINLLTWNRASNDLWNKWASITKDQGWAWENIQQFYLKTSRLVSPADNHNTTGEVIPSVHGNGPVEVSLPGFPTELDPLVINTSKQLGGRFAFNEDFNAGNTIGLGFMQSSIGGGQRSHSAAAYLEPVLNRSNLDVLINTQFTRLIQSGGKGKIPEFKTAEIAQGPLAQRLLVQATKEIIVSAGVFGTPHLLLLSGIGPKKDLQKLGINVLVDNASVGKNFTDHPMMPNYFLVNSTQTFDKILRNASIFNSTLETWLTSKQGEFVDSPGNTQGFMRLPENSTIFKTFKDPASGPQSGHTELIFIDGFAQFGPLPPPPTGNFMTILTAVASPVSRGSVSLNSTNPFAHPLIDPGVLTSDFDIFAMVQAMNDAQAFIKTSLWKNLVISPFGALANATTDAAKAAFARSVSVTVNHPSGSASMSPADAPWGVVDSKLVLKGATGVRIVDASIFPLIPEGHIQAPVYTVAERAADIIKETYKI